MGSTTRALVGAPRPKVKQKHPHLKPKPKPDVDADLEIDDEDDELMPMASTRKPVQAAVVVGGDDDLSFAERMRALALSVRPAPVSNDAVVAGMHQYILSAVEERAEQGKLTLSIGFDAELELEDADVAWALSELSDKQIDDLRNTLAEFAGLTTLIRGTGPTKRLSVTW